MAEGNAVSAIMNSICKTCHGAPCSCKKDPELKPVAPMEDPLDEIKVVEPSPPELQDSTVVEKRSTVRNYIYRFICGKKDPKVGPEALEMQKVKDDVNCPEPSPPEPPQNDVQVEEIRGSQPPAVPKQSNSIRDILCNMLICYSGKNIRQSLNLDLQEVLTLYK